MTSGMVDRRRSVIRGGFVAAMAGVLLLPASEAIAQDVSAGRVGDSAVGQVGQRQTRDQASENVEPLVRVDARIRNRIQSRIRNRIDRNYDPQANATEPFTIGADQLRTGPRAYRR